MAVAVILIIFVILAAFLYWLSNCKKWQGSDANLLYALASAGILMFVIWNLFSNTGFIWKLFDILIIILILYSYWSITKQCNFFNTIQNRIAT